MYVHPISSSLTAPACSTTRQIEGLAKTMRKRTILWRRMILAKGRFYGPGHDMPFSKRPWSTIARLISRVDSLPQTADHGAPSTWLRPLCNAYTADIICIDPFLLLSSSFVVKYLGIYSNLLSQISTTAKAPRLIGLAYYLHTTFALQSP